MFSLHETVKRVSIVRKDNLYIVAVLTDKRVTEHSEHTSFNAAFNVWKELSN